MLYVTFRCLHEPIRLQHFTQSLISAFLPLPLPELQRLIMTGVQVHLESQLSGQRHIGMAVGECLFNKLHPQDTERQLKFEYETTDDIMALRLLSRPITEQEAELKVWREGRGLTTSNLKEDESASNRSKGEEGVVVGVVKEERFGEGFVEATECSDTDRWVGKGSLVIKVTLP